MFLLWNRLLSDITVTFLNSKFYFYLFITNFYRVVPSKVSTGGTRGIDVLGIQQINEVDYELTPDQIHKAQVDHPQHHVVIDVDVDKLGRLYDVGFYPIILFLKYPDTKSVKFEFINKFFYLEIFKCILLISLQRSKHRNV